MNNPPPLPLAIDDSTGTPPPFVPMSSPPSHQHTLMNNPPVVHQVIYISTQPTPAAAVDDRFFKRMIKKSDAFTLGLFFASFGLLYFFLRNPSSDDHFAFAIGLGLRLIVLLITGFLYSFSCFSDPGPEFPKVQMTVLGFCVGLLALAMFLSRHT